MQSDLASRRQAMTAFAGLAGAALLTAPAGGAMAQTVMPATIGVNQWRMMTLMAGTYSKMTSVVAQSKATHAKVKQFGMFETGEQTVVAQTLTDRANPPPAPLDATHQAKLAALQATPPGPAFDLAYVAGQIEGHHELEQIQQSFLNSAPTDHNARHLAMLSRWSIQQHLVLLGDLQTMLATG